MGIQNDESLREIFESRTIAVVGCSSTPGKAAHDVPRYLQDQGYDIVPVNPHADEILGRESVDSLRDVDHEIDVVSIFRPSEEVPDIVDDVLERDDVTVLWTQLGIVNDEAADRARDAGITVVQDRCMKVEHRRLSG